MAVWLTVFAAVGVVVPRPAVGTDVPGGVISQDATWTYAGSPYRIFGDVIVAANAVLEIEAGVGVVFEGNWTLQGNIYANGTAAAPIVFTSSTPPTAPFQWGPLALRSGKHFRVYGASGLIVRGGPVLGCEVAMAEYGMSIGPYVRGRVEDCTVRDVRGAALILEGTREFVIANLTIQRVGVALALLHFGPPDTGKDAVRNLLTHLSISNALEGVRRTVGTGPAEPGNALVHSRFQDVQTVFADPFPGVVHHNTFLRYLFEFWGGGNPTGNYDDGAEGNHWDTYSGSDGDGDGVGDTSHAWDRYPLVAPPQLAGTYAAPFPPPYVESMNPPSGSSGIPTRATVRIHFSEPMAPSLPGDVLTASPALHGRPAWSRGQDLLVLPADATARLLSSTTYELWVAGWLPSLHGVPLGADRVLTFATRPAPQVESSSPVAGAEGVPVDVEIVIRFNVPMNTTSVEDALALDGAKAYEISWSGDRREARVVPNGPLSAGQVHSITVEPTAKDDDGLTIPRLQMSFQTVARVDTWAPGTAGFYGAIALVSALVVVLTWIGVRPPRKQRP